MPFGQIDTPNVGIYGGGGASQSNAVMNPMATLDGMMKLQDTMAQVQQRQLAAQKLQEDQVDDQAIRATLQKYDRPDEAVADLYRQGRMNAAGKLAGQVDTQRKSAADTYDKKMTATHSMFTNVAQMLQNVGDDASYQPVRNAVIQMATPLMGPGVADFLPAHYDKQKLDEVIGFGTSRAERIQQDKNALDAWQKAAEQGFTSNPYGYNDPKTGQFVPGPLALAPGMKVGPEWSQKALEMQQYWKGNIVRPFLTDVKSQDEWNSRLNALHRMGMPEEVADQIPDWNPDTKQVNQRLQDLGTTAKEKYDIAHGDQTLADEQKRTQIMQGELDVKRQAETRLSEAANAPLKPLTQAQKFKIDSDADKENAATSAWLMNLHGWDTRDKGAQRNDPDVRTDAAGRMYVLKDPTKPDVPENQLKYDPWMAITPEDKAEFVRRKVQTEDNRREHYGYSPFAAAAQAAVDRGDRAQYDILAKKYEAVTNGQSTLQSIAPWVKPTPGGTIQGGTTQGATSTAPASAPPQARKMFTPADKKQMDSMQAEYAATTTSLARKRQLQGQMRDLAAKYQ